mmetsp:Transcript_56461/g.134554  ORF Transcript_56461/g.134554 Transcript_56461/m.134554 type:complete len:200 (+) Transcript_56461:1448-2047(+)
MLSIKGVLCEVRCLHSCFWWSCQLLLLALLLLLLLLLLWMLRLLWLQLLLWSLLLHLRWLLQRALPHSGWPVEAAAALLCILWLRWLQNLPMRADAASSKAVALLRLVCMQRKPHKIDGALGFTNGAPNVSPLCSCGGRRPRPWKLLDGCTVGRQYGHGWASFRECRLPRLLCCLRVGNEACKGLHLWRSASHLGLCGR